MLQLKAKFGLLVGSSIRLFYDGKENPQQRPLMLSRIPFEKDTDEGSTLVSIFNKPDFLKERYRPHIRKLLKAFTEGRNIKKLKEILVDPATKQSIYQFLRDEFAEYGSDVVDGALKDLSIDLSFDTEPPPKMMETEVSDKDSLLKTVFDTIRSKPQGISKSRLIQITGYDSKQISNAVYKLSKRRAVENKGRGIYVAVSDSIPPPKKKRKPKKPAEVSLDKGTVLDSLYKIIKRRKTGFTISELKDESGLDSRQLSNALYKLSKKDLIESPTRGRYKSK